MINLKPVGDNFKDLLSIIHKRFPELEVRVKIREPEISYVLFNRLYLSSTDFPTLAHEYVHLIQMSYVGKLMYYFRWFFPQVLAIFPLLFSVFCMLLGNGLCAFAGILIAGFCVMPIWMAKDRLKIETEAHLMYMYCDYLTLGVVSDMTKREVFESITSKLYFGMISEKKAKILVNKMVSDLYSGRVPKNVAFRDVEKLLTKVY